MIHAFTASLPQRRTILERAVASVLPQVDTMQVVLNNYATVPRFLKHDKIKVVHSDNSLEDGSRFLGMNVDSGYVLVFDDDIIYPPNYCERMVAECDAMTEKYGKVIVTPMGKILKPRPVHSYYKTGVKTWVKTFADVRENVVVEVPGCCGALWNAEDVKITEDVVQTPNSDLCLAKFAKDNGIVCVVVAHDRRWLKNLMVMVPVNTPSIFGKYRRNDAGLTRFINAHL